MTGHKRKQVDATDEDAMVISDEEEAASDEVEAAASDEEEVFTYTVAFQTWEEADAWHRGYRIQNEDGTRTVFS